MAGIDPTKIFPNSFMAMAAKNGASRFYTTDIAVASPLIAKVAETTPEPPKQPTTVANAPRKL
jgi:hypothetical protein